MFKWIIENKGWLFDGVAVTVPTALIGWWLSTRSASNQKISSGDNSTNIQAGKNIRIVKRNNQ